METIETTGIQNNLDWRLQWRRIRSLRWKDAGRMFAEVFDLWSTYNVPRLAASVAFYTLLSLAPIVIVVVAVAGAVFGRDAAEGQLVWQIQDLVGRPGAETVQSLLRSVQQPGGAGILASIVGGIALLLGASSAAAEIRDSLNIIWCVQKRTTTAVQAIISVVLAKTVAFAMVLSAGFLLLVSLAVNAALAGFSEHYHGWFSSITTTLLQGADFLIAFGVIAGLFAAIYKVVPDIHLEWRDVIPGSLVTALLFSIGRMLIGMYLGRASYASVYGAAGSLVILLVWVYYSAQIFFFGAAFTRAYAQTFGSKPCDRIGREVKIASRVDEKPLPQQPEPREPMVRLS